MRVPALLSTIVECESLFNDAVAVALYRAVLVAVLAGSVDAAGMARISLGAIAGALGGIAIGVAFAFLAAAALRKRSKASWQIIATLVCAYAAYFAAEHLHCSGIFATIATGIALRSFERRWISLTVAEDVNRFWDVAALVANVLVFFLVGAALTWRSLPGIPGLWSRRLPAFWWRVLPLPDCCYRQATRANGST